jgi:hypothetical protein
MNKSINYKSWVFFFLVLLGLIPFFLSLNLVLVAKFLGITAVITLSIALWVWKTQLVERYGSNKRIKTNTNDIFWLNQHSELYKTLTKQEKIVFENRLGLFLGQFTFQNEAQGVNSKEAMLYLGASAVEAFWGFPPIKFNAFKSIGFSNDLESLQTNPSHDSPQFVLTFSIAQLKSTLQNHSAKAFWLPLVSMEKNYIDQLKMDRGENTFLFEVLERWGL